MCTQSEPRLTLDTVRPGRKCILRTVRGGGSTYQRLLEMGLVADTEVDVVRLAPLGDPMEISLHGYHLSLRKSDASMVEVSYA